MKVVTVRKVHYCADPKCRDVIKKGEKAKVLAKKLTRVDGSGSYWESYYYHLNCTIDPYFVG